MIHDALINCLVGCYDEEEVSYFELVNGKHYSEVVMDFLPCSRLPNLSP